RQARSPSPPKIVSTHGCGRRGLASAISGGMSSDLLPASGGLTSPAHLCSILPLALLDDVEMLIADQHDVGHAQEQPRPQHAGNVLHLRLEAARVVERLDLAVEDVTVVVSEGGLAVLGPQGRLAAQFTQLLLAE